MSAYKGYMAPLGWVFSYLYRFLSIKHVIARITADNTAGGWPPLSSPLKTTTGTIAPLIPLPALITVAWRKRRSLSSSYPCNILCSSQFWSQLLIYCSFFTLINIFIEYLLWDKQRFKTPANRYAKADPARPSADTTTDATGLSAV